LGKYYRSLELEYSILADVLNKLGENNVGVASIYQSVGHTYQKLGDQIKALEFYQKSLEFRIKLFGENHADVA
jgi:tetratricopeptide (TPR) repeat protein